MVNIVTSKTRRKSRADMRQVHERRAHLSKKIGRNLWSGPVEMPKAPTLDPTTPLDACGRMERNIIEHHEKVNRTGPTSEQKQAIKKRVREEIAPRVARKKEEKK